MRLISTVILASLLSVSACQARPGPPVPPPAGNTTTTSEPGARRFLFTGVVTFVGGTSIEVDGKDLSGKTGKWTFQISSDTNLPKNLKTGAHVMVSYLPTSSVGTQKAVTVVPLPSSNTGRPTPPAR